MLIDPHGKSYITNDLIKFCDQKALSAVEMYELACSPETQTHQEWQSKFV